MHIRLAFIGLIAIAASASGQDMRTITGTVTDSGGQPIPYVSVDGGPKYRTLANAVGEFKLVVPAKDRMEIGVRRIGYLPEKVRLEPGSDTTITIPLQRLAALLSTQVVRAQQLVRSLELRGFYERMADAERGALVGDFITPEEIEMRNATRVTQLLDQKRGIRVMRTGACNIVVQCFRVMGQGNCPATIYMDGTRLNKLGAAAGDPSGAPAIDELVPVTGVSGIEVYPRGSSAPAKYQSLSGTCAIVVIWTK